MSHEGQTFGRLKVVIFSHLTENVHLLLKQDQHARDFKHTKDHEGYTTCVLQSRVYLKRNILSTRYQKSFCRKRALSACYDILITGRLWKGQLLNWVMACVLWNAWSKKSIYHALGWMKQRPTVPCSFSCYNNSRLVLGPSERKKKKKRKENSICALAGQQASWLYWLPSNRLTRCDTCSLPLKLWAVPSRCILHVLNVM